MARQRSEPMRGLLVRGVAGRSSAERRAIYQEGRAEAGAGAASTGSWETSRFHGLSAGKTLRAGSGGGTNVPPGSVPERRHAITTLVAAGAVTPMIARTMGVGTRAAVRVPAGGAAYM